MELTLIVYAVSVLDNMTKAVAVLLILLSISFLFFYIVINNNTYYMFSDAKNQQIVNDASDKYSWMQRPRTALVLLCVLVLSPSERTMQYMAGAYLIQSVYESTEAREIGAASKKAVMSQLEVWSKGNEQLLTLIEQIKPAVQEKVHDYSTTGAQQ
jgi:CHASE3 domain sensor protein